MPRQEEKTISQADIYVIQGDDDLSIRDHVSVLVNQYAAGGFMDMNTVRLDGRTVGHAEISTALNMLPLGGSKRIVVLDHALEVAKGDEGQAWLENALSRLPATTVFTMILVDSQKYSQGKMVWIAVAGAHWLRKALKASNRSVKWIESPLPSVRDMPDWILEEARAQGGEFEPGAAAELANLIGSNTSQARSEVSKALSYVGSGQKVSRDVVHLLCSPSREEDIFAMVDAAGRRDARNALSLMHGLLRDQPIQYIFSMLARQLRLLIMAKEIIENRGGEKEIISGAGVHPFVARKLIDQARRFRMNELERIYSRLDRIDEAAKTGRESLDVALETLITDLSRKQVS